MNNRKRIIIIILTILVTSLISFVIIMQHNFMNPDFATAESTVEPTNAKEENVVEVKVEEKQKPHEDEKETISIQYVAAELLNVREGPGTETDIVGVVTLDQEVEVEEMNNPDGWVKITTEDFTGYVNSKYLEKDK
ncbi:SH3 domain-containing protein [Oceanobacillus bengalensis]|nr:SH3 domain-containing protein [Oceanobacillus bengalensis]